MPGMSGADTCSRILDLDPGMKVLISSGFNEKDALKQIPVESVAGFIQKPYGLAALDEKLRQILP